MVVGMGFEVKGVTAKGGSAIDSKASFLEADSSELHEWVTELLAWPDVDHVEVRRSMVEVFIEEDE